MTTMDITKGKICEQVGYKKLGALLDKDGRDQVADILKSESVCEVREQQTLSNGAQTITIKFYFYPNQL